MNTRGCCHKAAVAQFEILSQHYSMVMRKTTQILSAGLPLSMPRLENQN